jgi:hypothetical protein
MRPDGGAPPIPAAAKLADKMFFGEYPDRKFRLREPIGDEYEREFIQLGMHEKHRRRIIVFRIAAGLAKRHGVDFGRIPFLLFADETVEDTDAVIGPILREIMGEAAKAYGMEPCLSGCHTQELEVDERH